MKRLGILLLLAPWLPAQDFRGSLVGTVTDASGGRIRAAAISLTAVGSSIERHATSDARGEFRFDDLLPGAWLAIVNAPGFA